jgi:hypothetical protein
MAEAKFRFSQRIARTVKRLLIWNISALNLSNEEPLAVTFVHPLAGG